ncbi:hypothetical protein Hanom_Chr01g00001711 [Helianthus anomalus]
MPFSSLRFDQFCDFRPKVCFFTSESKRFEILPFSSGSLTPSISLREIKGIFVNLKGNLVFSHYVQAFSIMYKYSNYPCQIKKTKIHLTSRRKWMELRSRMKMARYQTFWIQVRKNKPVDESRKTGQTSWTKMTFNNPN